MNPSFRRGFEKIAAGRVPATIVGGLAQPFAGLAAEPGKGWRTAGGAILGSVIGAELARGLSPEVMRSGRNLHKIIGAMAVGSALGGAGGAYLAHGKDTGSYVAHKKRK